MGLKGKRKCKKTFHEFLINKRKREIEYSFETKRCIDRSK